MLTEDLTAFFNTADFAIAATYDGATTVNVIFDHEFLLQLGLVAGRAPAALVRAADVAANPTGKTLVVNGMSYVIRGIEPLDDGVTAVLRLEG